MRKWRKCAPLRALTIQSAKTTVKFFLADASGILIKWASFGADAGIDEGSGAEASEDNMALVDFRYLGERLEDFDSGELIAEYSVGGSIRLDPDSDSRLTPEVCLARDLVHGLTCHRMHGEVLTCFLLN